MTPLIEKPAIMNNILAQHIVEQMIQNGVKECCLAAGSRNAPLVYALNATNQIKVYNWPEERSAAFFAIGRIKATNRPVAIITTSGTAAAEVLPAAMSAHYLGLPLLMITADRPRRFRGSGAPQTSEQPGLFGCYAHFELDLADDEKCNLDEWTCKGPAHLNICFEEPRESECKMIQVKRNLPDQWLNKPNVFHEEHLERYHNFIQIVKNPLVVVGALDVKNREIVIQYLLQLGAPVYAEAFSNIREDNRLEHLKITRIDNIWNTAEKNNYPIDGILRIGEIPTARLWRDLEEKGGQVKVCSISEQPFSGLSWADVIYTSLEKFFIAACERRLKKDFKFKQWVEADSLFQATLLNLLHEEPFAESSLIHSLSKIISPNSNIYLGNSLPIREWDLAASHSSRGYFMHASRGVNGIDGQISTFFGLSDPHKDNWAIIGDLTALYDMVGPWILPQITDTSVNLIVVNNGGGQIFSRMYSLPIFTNPHQLNYEHLAHFWKMHYEKWDCIPNNVASNHKHRLIEITPDVTSTDRFWTKFTKL